MKLTLALVVAVAAAGIVATAGSSTTTGRSGALHVTKECSQYQGQAGQFCTIKSSNIPWIKAGMKVVYADAADFGSLMLDTDVVLSRGDGSAAEGHVNLDLATALGTVTFDGGRGAFKTFQGNVTVTVTDRGQSNELWHWDGTYSFGSDD